MTMRLCEAIRLGAMLKEQEFGPSAKFGKSCALRAAQEALGIPAYVVAGDLTAEYGGDLNYQALMDLYSFLNVGENVHHCPACDAVETDAIDVIYHLNDQHRWTREAIADWVEKTFETPRALVADDDRVTVG